ncbi:MAG: ribose-phosphate pyrophosphokinase [Alphaproteobacteria bacterium]|nr:ribose-phosphate pyrophosphokinase [Alphaproteobacteria bacterium]
MIYPFKLFHGNQMKDFASKICGVINQPLGKVNLEVFSDGEIMPVFLESVRGDYVFLIQSTHSPAENLLELLLMIDAAKRASAYKIIAVIPYFGYARQDRKDKPRVAIGSKLIANLLVSAGVNRVITMDLHAPQIQGFFEIPVDHLDSAVIFIPYIQKLNLDNIVFAAPDVGSSKRVREIAIYFSAEMVICDKHRSRANEIASMVLIGDVKDKHVIIFDDICDTAGTLTRAAQLIMDNGAKSVRAVITHPVLSGNAYQNINNSVLEELIVTDSIPFKPDAVACPKLKVLSATTLFAEAIQNAASNKSISDLFVYTKLKSKYKDQ